MTYQQLSKLIQHKQSCLCVGLDSDIDQLPQGVPSNPQGVLHFNRKIIQSTREFCVAYKLNTAFYECMGAEGWDVMQSTIEFIGEDHLVIADAKRGDIGNTAKMYASAFFDRLQADAITLNPYMGSDTIKPFLEYPGKWGIVLALTSNASGKQLQQLKVNGKSVFQHVVDMALQVGDAENVMFVVGGTRPSDLREMREYCPDCFFLVPGVGKQGGTVAEVMKAGQQKNGAGLLINSSRGIIFSSSGADYAESAAREAKNMQRQMAEFIAG